MFQNSIVPIGSFIIRRLGRRRLNFHQIRNHTNNWKFKIITKYWIIEFYNFSDDARYLLHRGIRKTIFNISGPIHVLKHQIDSFITIYMFKKNIIRILNIHHSI